MDARPDGRPLFERVRPRRLEELVGDPGAVRAASDWARGWAASARPPRWRALLLSGPPGVGKTTMAWALARSFGWTVVEMNASDARNQTSVEEIAGRASLSHTLGSDGTIRAPSEGGRALILLDEADSLSGRADAPSASRPARRSFREFLIGRFGDVASLFDAWGLGAPGRPAAFESWDAVPAVGSGRAGWARLKEAQRDLGDWRDASRPVDTSDRGGYGAMLRLVRETRQPVAITANDEAELFRHVPALRSLVLRIRLGPVGERELGRYLRGVVRSEGLPIDDEEIDPVVRRSQGDVRAALNDLEAIAPLPRGPLRQMVLSGRDLRSDLFYATGKILREPRYYRSVEVRDLTDTSPEELWPWIEENLPRFSPTNDALSAAFDALAEAESLVARARRSRDYGLWSYAVEGMTGGTSLALARRSSARPSSVAFPEFLSGMGRSRGSRALRSSILGKAGPFLHMSRRKLTAEFEPFLTEVFSSPHAGGRTPARALRRALSSALALSEEEVSFLGGNPREDMDREEERNGRISPSPSGNPIPSDARVAAEPSLPAPDSPPPPSSRKVQKRLGDF